MSEVTDSLDKALKIIDVELDKLEKLSNQKNKIEKILVFFICLLK